MEKKPTYEELEHRIQELEKTEIELKQAEEALRMNEERYRMSQAISHAGSWEYNLKTTHFWGSPEAKHIYGFDPEQEEFSTEEVENCIPERERVHQALVDLIESGKPYNLEFEIHPKGSTEPKIISSVAELKQSVQGEPIVAGVIHDITKRKLYEKERDKLQSQLSNAIEMAHLGHWEYDVDNDLFTFNDHFYKIFRTTAEDVGGYTMSSAEYASRFIHPDDAHLVEAESRLAAETTDPNFSRQLEHKMLYGDGTVGHISVRFFIVKDAQGRTIKTYGVNQDITERKRMEEELLKAQKLESTGILAGGIAHDFNNILMVVIWNLSLAKTLLAQGEDPSELLVEAEQASNRAKTLTKQLLTFAKGGAPIKETASMKDVIKESILFVLRGSKTSCEFSISEDLWSAEVDVGQMNQVINNIVINANHAMPEGGTIHVATENLTIDDSYGLPLTPGRYIRISITDHGVGIAEKHLAKIFDPYFTTKQEGSGLGLATTWSIIKKHDGHIAVQSRIGIGTTFHIYLPASDKAVHDKEKAKLIKGQGRILVMDDEESLLKLFGRILKKIGYESEFAKGGDEAVRMYKEAREAEKPFDAVILDLTIPGGMGGQDTLEELLEIDPEVKAIVSSGYSDDPVLANFQEYGFKAMIPKPFEIHLLGKVLHDVLKGEK